MNREEAHKKVKDWIDEVSKPGKIGKWHYGKFELHRDIDRLYDNFEKDLKDINNQLSRLKKQLLKGHHIECGCSFCKPVACSYVDNNFTFTSCNDCKNKIDGTYQEICSNCKRFYGCYFEAKEV